MPVEFTRVARVSEVPERRSKLVHVEDVPIALWRVGGRVYAINNVCPHQHISALHLGTLNGTCVTCPMHGWSFSLETGNPTFGEGRARVYQTRVVGESIMVETPVSVW